MIKIVHIAQSNGGVECYLKMFFKYIDKSKYENYLIVPKQYESSIKDFEKLGVKVYIVEMVREISPINDFKSFMNILRILKSIKPNIVYSHSSKAGAIGRPAAKLLNIKNIYNPHGWAFDMNLSNHKKRVIVMIEKILSIFSDKIIAISNYEKDIAIKNKIAIIDKIIVIENAIDFKSFQEYNNNISNENILQELGWSNNVIIGMIARISEQKSPETFVNIAELVIKENQNCKFMIVGDGERKKEIEEIISRKKLDDSFYITGWTKDIKKYLYCFDIALLTSKWEGFGLVIPEYMAAKKPVVASNVGGIANIISDSENGFLIDNLDEVKFLEKINDLIKNQKLKDRIVDNAYEVVKNKYSFERVIKEHESIFESLILQGDNNEKDSCI